MCEFLVNNDKCKKKACYGNFCKKHRREYLIRDNKIIIERFTNNLYDFQLFRKMVRCCLIFYWFK